MSNRSSLEQVADSQLTENLQETERVVFETDTVDEDFPVPVAENEDYNDMNANDDDDFSDGFVDAENNDDDFGDFDDFKNTAQVPEPQALTEAEIYSDILSRHSTEEIHNYFNDYLNRLWFSTYKNDITETVSINETEAGVLNTSCSRNLWSKLSRDTAFYNPITGAVGQFQWTRSETNKLYLNALGVTIKHEKPAPPMSPSQRKIKKRETVATMDTPISTPVSPALSPTLRRSASVSNGLKVTTPKMDEASKEAKREAEQELELDIDIARAYCELTEETIRVFPNVKLNAMVNELTRLQKQAEEYLDQLLDQQEKLKMDSETYNDLISCIVGHAQRLHVHSKDGSPAMVTKTKKTSSFNFGKRKPSSASIQSASMGGGVVGLKKQPPTPKNTVSSTRPHSTSDTR